MAMDLKIGVGKCDITGPCAGVGFLGYWDFKQKGAGILSRLFSRAFVIEDQSNGKSVAIVCADICMCSLSVQQAVIKKLKERFGETYTEKNVLISGNHTHSGTGGYSYYLMYNASMLGFNKQNFDCIVDGIFQSIVNADKNKAGGHILIKTGEVQDCGGNRSLSAYKNNEEFKNNPSSWPPEEKEMTLLKFIDGTDKAIGSLNWYAVHGTNFGQKNRLITGDNKGYAEELFEKDKGVTSAFANSCCGDISPNMGLGVPDGIHDFEHAMTFGKRQYEEAVMLFDTAKEELPGSVDYRQAYVDMSNCAIDADRRTWPAALGLSVTSGSSEDSVGFPIWPEGTTRDKVKHDPNLIRQILVRFLPGLFGLPHEAGAMEKEFIEGHAEKPILAALGNMKLIGIPWAPSIVPLQLIRLGSLIIIAHPGEMTTMAGRRMRRTILDILGDGVKHAVVAAYAGAYTSYTTTREEYAIQDYEGAATLFGPWTLVAYQQENAKLATAMKNNVPSEPGPQPADLSSEQVGFETGQSFFDAKPHSQDFGDVKKQPKSCYKRGDKVKVSFYGANPNNNPRTGGTYLRIDKRDKQDAGKWNEVYTDSDFCTCFRWEKAGGNISLVTIEWQIPSTQDSGVYRIVYYGTWKPVSQGLKEFSGMSREFEVVSSARKQARGI